MKEYVTKDKARQASPGAPGKVPWLKFNVGQGLILLALEIETGKRTNFKDDATILTVQDTQKKTYKLEWKESCGVLRDDGVGGFELVFENGAVEKFPLKFPFFLHRVESMKYRLLMPGDREEAIALWTGKLNPLGTPNTPVVPTGDGLDFTAL